MQWFNRLWSQLNAADPKVGAGPDAGPDAGSAGGADARGWAPLLRKHRWLLIVLCVAAVIGGGWLIQSRSPAMEALSGFVVPDAAAAVQQLTESGLTARVVHGQVQVRVDQQHQAIAVLQQEHLPIQAHAQP